MFEDTYHEIKRFQSCVFTHQNHLWICWNHEGVGEIGEGCLHSTFSDVPTLGYESTTGGTVGAFSLWPLVYHSPSLTSESCAYVQPDVKMFSPDCRSSVSTCWILNGCWSLWHFQIWKYHHQKTAYLPTEFFCYAMLVFFGAWTRIPLMVGFFPPLHIHQFHIFLKKQSADRRDGTSTHMPRSSIRKHLSDLGLVKGMTPSHEGNGGCRLAADIGLLLMWHS